MEMRHPYYLALAVECLVWVGEFSEARLVLEEALAIVDKTGERWSEGELLRLRGEIEARDDFAAAEASFQAALKIARRQATKAWELRSATSLARLWQGQGRYDDARDLLKPVHDWFTEGFDTPDLIEAKALLDALAYTKVG